MICVYLVVQKRVFMNEGTAGVVACNLIFLPRMFSGYME